MAPGPWGIARIPAVHARSPMFKNRNIASLSQLDPDLILASLFLIVFVDLRAQPARFDANDPAAFKDLGQASNGGLYFGKFRHDR